MGLDEAAAPEREADGVDDEHVVAGVQPQHEVHIERAQEGHPERACDGDEGAGCHLADDLRLVLADVLVYGYR